MSVQAYFSEVEAVVSVLQGHVNAHEPEDIEALGEVGGEYGDVVFAALWQAAELLARAHAYISAQVNAEMAMAALNLPDVQQAPKPTLYGPDGETL